MASADPLTSVAVFSALLGVAVGWRFRGGRHPGFAQRLRERRPHPLGHPGRLGRGRVGDRHRTGPPGWPHERARRHRLQVAAAGQPGRINRVKLTYQFLAPVTGYLHHDAVEGKPPVRRSTGLTDLSNTIASLHRQLDLRFSELARRRQELPDQPPVYAIEHGLSEEDLSVLCDVVEALIYRSRPPREHWLPFIVYATEIGYSYEGDRYWPTLEEKAPGWEENATRHYLKSQFLQFKKIYNGAIPRGAWARQFSIICWPITHAILPTDLQRQFAQLLYEHRGALTSELLNDPPQLGRVLAARTQTTRKRFQQFAQNTDLLGHVAAALLADHKNVPTINPSTLTRITEDLSKESHARRWLKDAKISANRLLLKGVTRAQKSHRQAVGRPYDLLHPTAPVSFSLHLESAGWQLRLRVPDFTPLFARYPELREQIEQLRCRVTGTSGRPRARGWLLDSGQQVMLNKWPGHDAAIFELEGAPLQTAELFSNEARTPPYQPWLFWISPDGTGRLVRSGLVRSGFRYVLLGTDFAVPSVDWVSEQTTECEGTICLLIEIPENMDSTITQTVRQLGCGLQTSVEVSPVGFVPAAWDGDGVGEWVVGDNPIIKLKCIHEIITCTATLNEISSVHLSSEEFTDNAAVLELRDLSQGWHDLRLSFLVPETAHPIPDLSLHIHMREAELRRASGTFRDPLRLRVTPSRASLEDVWGGQASVTADGPLGTQTSLKVALLENSGILADHKFKITLPITSAEWSDMFEAQVRQSERFQEAYDHATHLEFLLDDDNFGHVKLLLDRELVPLRWGFQRVRNHTILRLYESTDTGKTPKVIHYPFKTPDIGREVTPEAGREASEYFYSTGGLFVAQLDDHEAKAILPPTVHDIQDLKSARSAVYLHKHKRTEKGIAHLVHLAELWSNARYPGHLLARDRRAVVAAAINRKIGSLIGGQKWAFIEQKHSDGKRLQIGKLNAALAKPGHWTAFRNRITTLANSLKQLEEPPVEQFSKIIQNSPVRHRPELHTFSQTRSRIADLSVDTPGSIGGVTVTSTSHSKIADSPAKRFMKENWLAELNLRLASAPESIIGWSDGREELYLNQILKYPIIYRAARMLVIVAHQEGQVWEWN